MDDMIERLEKATGPDHELDVDIWCAVYAPDAVVVDFGVKAPTYTASIDAALTLVPEGWASLRFIRTGTTYGCFLEAIDTNAATPAIALCIAALKARAALSPTSERGKA